MQTPRHLQHQDTEVQSTQYFSVLPSSFDKSNMTIVIIFFVQVASSANTQAIAADAPCECDFHAKELQRVEHNVLLIIK